MKINRTWIVLTRLALGACGLLILTTELVPAFRTGGDEGRVLMRALAAFLLLAAAIPFGAPRKRAPGEPPEDL